MNRLSRAMTRCAAIGSLGTVFTITQPGFSQAGRWSVEAAGDYVESGRVATRTNESRSFGVGASGAPVYSLRLMRDLGRHVAMLGTLTYLPFGRDATSNRAQFVPVAFGVRLSPASGEGRKGGPYVELSPALVWSRWRVPYYGIDQATYLRPGLIAGLGVHGQVANGIGIDVGLRYFLSGNGGTLSARPSDSQSLEGLQRAGLHFGLTYAR
jgi:hypothetical protein